MDAEQAEIQERLEEVFQSMLCPVSGCWCLHGCHYEYYYDEGCECHVLEVWPIGFEEPEEHGGNGHQKTGEDICYELAEFEFGEEGPIQPIEEQYGKAKTQINHRRTLGNRLDERVGLGV